MYHQQPPPQKVTFIQASLVIPATTDQSEHLPTLPLSLNCSTSSIHHRRFDFVSPIDWRWIKISSLHCLPWLFIIVILFSFDLPSSESTTIIVAVSSFKIRNWSWFTASRLVFLAIFARRCGTIHCRTWSALNPSPVGFALKYESKFFIFGLDSLKPDPVHSNRLDSLQPNRFTPSLQLYLAWLSRSAPIVAAKVKSGYVSCIIIFIYRIIYHIIYHIIK